MPREVVNEQVWRQSSVRVCAKCRRRMPEAVQNRGTYNMVGSVAGSLGTSAAGGAIAGSFLGPVGALGGAITGAIAGSMLGANASDKACDVVEASSGDLCEDCLKKPANRTGQTDFGGGRLGGTDDPGTSGRSTAAPASTQGAEQEGVGAQAAAAASVAGEKVGAVAGAVGEKAGAAASAAGEKLGEGWSWLRQSVSGVGGGGKKADEPPQGQRLGGRGAGTSFQAFQGEGRALGSTETERPRNPSRLVGGYPPNGGASAPPVAGPAAAAPAAGPPVAASGASVPQSPSQMEEDEALARRLQQQFLEEEQQQR